METNVDGSTGPESSTKRCVKVLQVLIYIATRDHLFKPFVPPYFVHETTAKRLTTCSSKRRINRVAGISTTPSCLDLSLSACLVF